MRVLPLVAVDTPATVEIDGQTYSVPAADADGNLIVALDLTALAAPTIVVSDQKTVTSAGTAVQLQTQPCKSVTVKALAGNTGKIYVGDNVVSSSNGLELEAGDAVNLAIDNVNRLWIDSSVNGEGVSWLAVL